MEIGFQVQIKIGRSVEEVFNNVYLPEKLSGYFTNGGASAELSEGSTVDWSFEDSPGKKITFPVHVVRAVQDELIEIAWQSRTDGGNTSVRIEFTPDGSDKTIVKISESGWESTQEDLNRSYGNCMGWSQMLSALKAYSEYGIDLRKGAYDGLY